MMVETILESSQDFGMSNGSLPQWKRELLQRRAARSRTTAPPPAAPPPPPPPPPPPLPQDMSNVDDEELRYGPGIVKRLKSRYLSLALRDAPRRRPSVLRRAASLEHLLDERAPPLPVPRPAPALRRPPRPASVAASPQTLTPRALASRRESVKRARSVDALSRLERDDPPPPSPSPPPPPALPRPAPPRSARPPRRPTPLLRDTERPPVDLVRSALRKFESTPVRRLHPAARVSAVLRELEPPPRTSTPEPARELSPARSPSPLIIDPVVPYEEPIAAPQPGGAKLVSRAALEEIARAGSTTRYAFDAPRAGSHLPPLAATNSVLVGRARRVGVIRPMPAPPLRADRDCTTPCLTRSDTTSKTEDAVSRVSSPPPVEPEVALVRAERRDAPPSAAIEPMPRLEPARAPSPVVNGRASPEQKPSIGLRKIGSAGIERAWSGTASSVPPAPTDPSPWGAQRKSRAPPPAATTMVFNFSDRKEVPNYIENDGIVLRSSRKNAFKAGEAGVVVLRPEALLRESESDDETDWCEPPSPCGVRFLNDNVLINGRSSMTSNPNRDRIAKLKLQFDDSLTCTFEYPSESSLCEESPGEERAPQPAPAPAPTTALASNTHMASAALSRYTPSKTVAAPFQLGLTRRDTASLDPHQPTPTNGETGPASERSAEAEGEGDVRPCGAGAGAARSWSECRTHTTDLLF